MQDWLMAQIAQGLPAFKGATVSGSIPVKEELINELIARALAGARQPAPPAAGFDARGLLGLVRRAEVHAQPGVVTLQFEIGV